MTFDASIPQATDLISQSQSQIQTNFSQSNTAFGIDHTAFDVVSNQGKHKKSTYVDQASNPSTSANEVALYTKNLSGASTLYLRKESNGTVVQMSGPDPVVAASGLSFLPGGIIIQWGTYTITNGNATVAVLFSSSFTTVYSLVITGNGSADSSRPYYTSLSASGFTGGRGGTAGTVNYTYIAIGS